MADDISLVPRIALLETSLKRLELLEPLLHHILPIITVGGFHGTDRTDTIEKQRTRECKTVVTVGVLYEIKSTTTTTNPTTGAVTRICTTYEITTTIGVREICEPGSTTDKGTATHVTTKQFCIDGAGVPAGQDAPQPGATTGFDGKQTDTLTYPHGTKVKVELSGTTVTVTITFADGTSTSVTIPSP